MDRICFGLLVLLANVVIGQDATVIPTVDQAQTKAICACGCGIAGCQCCSKSAERIRALEAELAALKATKQPDEQQAKIVMQSIPGCLACEQWMLTESPKLIAVGWAVEQEKLRSGVAGRIYPRWRACNLGRCVEIENCSLRIFMDRLRTFVNDVQSSRKTW